jgi:hypothetical protein
MPDWELRRDVTGTPDCQPQIVQKRAPFQLGTGLASRIFPEALPAAL